MKTCCPFQRAMRPTMPTVKGPSLFKGADATGGIGLGITHPSTPIAARVEREFAITAVGSRRAAAWTIVVARGPR